MTSELWHHIHGEFNVDWEAWLWHVSYLWTLLNPACDGLHVFGLKFVSKSKIEQTCRKLFSSLRCDWKRRLARQCGDPDFGHLHIKPTQSRQGRTSGPNQNLLHLPEVLWLLWEWQRLVSLWLIWSHFTVSEAGLRSNLDWNQNWATVKPQHPRFPL